MRQLSAKRQESRAVLGVMEMLCHDCPGSYLVEFIY